VVVYDVPLLASRKCRAIRTFVMSSDSSSWWWSASVDGTAWHFGGLTRAEAQSTTDGVPLRPPERAGNGFAIADVVIDSDGSLEWPRG
jgi:hypothetical protein